MQDNAIIYLGKDHRNQLDTSSTSGQIHCSLDTSLMLRNWRAIVFVHVVPLTIFIPLFLIDVLGEPLGSTSDRILFGISITVLIATLLLVLSIRRAFKRANWRTTVDPSKSLIESRTLDTTYLIPSKDIILVEVQVPGNPIGVLKEERLVLVALSTDGSCIVPIWASNCTQHEFSSVCRQVMDASGNQQIHKIVHPQKSSATALVWIHPKTLMDQVKAL